MAWQNSVGMGPGNGGNAAGSGDVGGNGGQPQGTEYTLQGVMRFLQTEWHRHERERNAWQIERAEMKARIGKLEGDLRTNKKLRESMEKHIKMLENALRRTREQKMNGEESGKNNPDTADIKQSAKSSPNVKPNPKKSHDSILNLEYDDHSPSAQKQEAEREKSRIYLGKCIEEFAYHVFSSSSTQQQYLDEQEQMAHHEQYSNHQQPQEVSLADVYAQKQKTGNIGSLGPSPIPNHQPPPIPRVNEPHQSSRNVQPSEEAIHMSRNPSTRHNQPDRSQQTRSNEPRTAFDFANEESVEKVAHTYDAYGQPVSTQDEAERPSPIPADSPVDPDGWNFDDSPEDPPLLEDAPQDFPPPSRSDTDPFPNATNISVKSPNRLGDPHRRKTSLTRRRQSNDQPQDLLSLATSPRFQNSSAQPSQFRVKFGLRGHLDVVRAVIFTGGGSPSAPELCTAGDDAVLKRWIVAPPSSPSPSSKNEENNLDLRSDITHRGHVGPVLCLAASPTYQPFTNGGRAQGDGWVFSGGADATIRVWERGRVDPKATIDGGHTDAVWCICVLPGTSGSILGPELSPHHGGLDRSILISGGADGAILVWAVSSPPTLASPHTGSRRGTGGSRRANSISSGSNFPNSPQPNAAVSAQQNAQKFSYSLVHRIEPREGASSPTCITPLSPTGETFVVGFNDASILVFDTKSGEEIIAMASQETYDGTPATGVNAVVATSSPGSEGDDGVNAGGLILSGHEDRFVRFFDAASGQNVYSMLAHPAPISSLSLSPHNPSTNSSNRSSSPSPPSSSSSAAAYTHNELVSAGHDASIRIWNLETRSCIQELQSHRSFRGEGVGSVVWSGDGRYIVSAGGDGGVKVFVREPSDQTEQVEVQGHGEREGGEGWSF